MPFVKKFKTTIVFLLLTLVVTGCEIVGSDSGEPTLEQKIGQMLMVGFRGMTISPQDGIWHDIEACNTGGVVLYNYDTPSGGELARNIASPKQLKTRTTTLQGIRRDTLLIGVDQEGGLIRRLKPSRGFPDEASPSHQTLGELDEPSHTYNAAAGIASLLDEHGINVNVAPVVDVNTNPDHSIIAALQRTFLPTRRRSPRIHALISPHTIMSAL